MIKDDKVDQWINRPILGGEFAVEFLPTGRWQDENGKKYKGGRTYQIEVPLDRVPRFTRR